MRKFILAAVAAVFGLAALPSQADAAFALRLTSGASQITIFDNGAGDASGTLGQIQYNGGIGGFSVALTVGLGAPLLPNTPTLAEMHLTNLSLSSNLTTGASILIELSQNGLTFGQPYSGLELQSAIGGATQGTVVAQQIVNLSNTLFATTGAVINHGPFVHDPNTIGSTGFSDNQSLSFGPYGGGQFSITERVLISHAAGIRSTSFDVHSTVVVPVPASIALCLAGLPMFAGSWLARRRATKKQG
jgi:hypothetical protein